MLKNTFFILVLTFLFVDANGYVKVVPKTTFQYQLQGTIDISVNAQVYFIDLFEGIKQGAIQKLKNLGKVVFCYYSAGSYEDFRPDASNFPKSIIAGQYNGYPNEWWLDIRNFQTSGLAQIMQSRMDLAAQNGCDGVDPDNVNVYQNPNDSKLKITYQQQLDYNLFLANYAHSKNLAIALKNDGDQINDLINYFDVAVNESCNELNECSYLDKFVSQNKAAFGISYRDLYPSQTKDWQNICKSQMDKSYTWILKYQSLQSQIEQCGYGLTNTFSSNKKQLLDKIILLFILINLFF
ncbi:endo alpha-1,4 polygalactosaminidase precursor (macronuclear) [Tetrahymena thermophila SB210]|uniref:Endo alpha-1,4 polygalactosaminidase n=1 Tax=Tetrahymena thermophila (strain SB210) TaxID=312017 RepID=W7XFY4_TETTS|nr:endo alpha-1,4 polygalactosaminidase precursor [Tetrahymena thermophila SB210]EWS71754.1 endo alpha-1,4 polygalactosaminidase precursor [Tetrahymena thermophila SB210]|eukprot:XP_012655707.1 endo alpha-1,4 polygalactosaminidase precursor [Tetrahymena thermophila SB210]